MAFLVTCNVRWWTRAGECRAGFTIAPVGVRLACVHGCNAPAWEFRRMDRRIRYATAYRLDAETGSGSTFRLLGVCPFARPFKIGPRIAQESQKIGVGH
jgi:hypothetical protein